MRWEPPKQTALVRTVFVITFVCDGCGKLKIVWDARPDKLESCLRCKVIMRFSRLTVRGESGQ